MANISSHRIQYLFVWNGNYLSIFNVNDTPDVFKFDTNKISFSEIANNHIIVSVVVDNMFYPKYRTGKHINIWKAKCLWRRKSTCMSYFDKRINIYHRFNYYNNVCLYNLMNPILCMDLCFRSNHKNMSCCYFAESMKFNNDCCGNWMFRLLIG
jgi:hypothetical protein